MPEYLEAATEDANVTCEGIKTELSEVRAELNKKEMELSELQREREDMRARYELLSKILTAPPSLNNGINQFYALLGNDFRCFSESALKFSIFNIVALESLKSIGHELEVLVSQADVRKRRLVAIVGAFSSGKSAFINSFILDTSIRLAEGIKPVTVIPSYVFSSVSSQPIIRGHVANHGHIDLDANLYKKFSHDFIDTFNLDLRSLMPFVSVGVKMDIKYFGNLCFIDTPGYNPPLSSNYSDKDKNTAKEFAQQADALIWLISVDNGTVPQSDLDFIRGIAQEDQPIYVVLTKAEQRAEEQVMEIMEEVRAVLDYEDFSVHGICAYSAMERRMIQHIGMGLMDYFKLINQYNNASSHLFQRLDGVFSAYNELIEDRIYHASHNAEILKSLELDILELTGDVELFDKASFHIKKFNLPMHPPKHLREQSNNLHNAFTDALKMALDGIMEGTSVSHISTSKSDYTQENLSHTKKKKKRRKRR